MSIDWGAVSGPPKPQNTPTSGIDWGKVAEQKRSNIGKRIDKAVGGAIVAGHQNPWGRFMDAMGAPQRGLMALETGQDARKAFMTPGMREELSKAVKQKIGLQQLESGALAGNDLGHKLARGTLDTALDIVNDPLTFLPVGGIASKIGKALPILGKGAEAAGGAIRRAVPFLDPEAYHAAEGWQHPLENLTPKGKATFQAATKIAGEKTNALAQSQEMVVKKNADAIRQGKMPNDVARLFAKKDSVPEARRGLRPQEVLDALSKDRAAYRSKQVADELNKVGLNKGQSTPAFEDRRALYVDPSKARETQDAIHAFVNQVPGKDGTLSKAARGLTMRGNQAFLANPIPHTGNLASISYGNYGPLRTLQGLGRAATIAAGKPTKATQEGIAELEKYGTKSQYRNIFDELGLTRIAGIPGTESLAKVANKAIIPAERASNALQHRVLNATETGLRTSALGAEKARGRVGPEAAAKIHDVFGTGPANPTIKALSRETGTPFAQFHMVTAPKTFARTTLANPGRTLAMQKAQRDYNQDVNGKYGPQYRSSTPLAGGPRAFLDPLTYFGSSLGPLAALQNPYGALALAKEGKIGQLAGETAGRFIPESQTLSALYNLATKRKGKSGEQALNDLIASIIGGYYSKAPAR